jgi:ABC-type nitrate/sulfonate/bicarbonate transport system substrate-binding protein
MWRRVAVLVCAMALAAACGGGGGDTAADDETTATAEAQDTAAEEGEPAGEPVLIRMGWGIPAEEIKYVMQATPEVAPNLGTCYEIEWNQFAGTALGVQGLAAGTLDGATVGGLSVANGIEQGADIVITGEFIEERSPNFSTAWMVAADSGINTVADLAGKTVATSAIGGSTDYIQDYYIEDEGGLVAGQDYEKVEVPFAQQVEGIGAGQFDMGIYPQPFYGALLASGDYEVVFRLTDVIDPFVQLLQGFRRDFVEENPEAVQCFMEDWATVADYVLDEANRDAVIEATNQATGIPVEVLEGFLLTQDDFYRPEGGAISVEALQNEWDFFRERGGIAQELQVEDYLIDVSVTAEDSG